MNLVRVVCNCIRLVVCICLAVFSLQAHAVETTTVKVGFFQFPGYHHVNEYGVRSGYGYEFLQKIALSNNFQYKYVGYDKSWAQMQEMLKSGEIDLLTSARKTPDRESEFDFSEPIGISSTVLSARAGDLKFTPGEYETYNGMRVGLIESNSRNESFDKFAKEKGFTYTKVFYKSTKELAKALQRGKDIDAIVTSNLRDTNNEWVMDEFDSSYFYAIVKKGNTDLLNKINRAIQILNRGDLSWKEDLFNKYYVPTTFKEISFSKAELNYLNDIKEKKKVFKVGVSPDRAPFSYFDKDGVAHGIMIDAFKIVADKLGIQYKIEPTAYKKDFHKNLAAKKYDIWIDAPYELSYVEDMGYKICNSYLTASISSISRMGEIGAKHSIGFIANSDLLRLFASYFYKTGDSFYYYKNLDDTFNALQDGTVDKIYAYTYVAQRLIADDYSNKYVVSLMPNSSISFSIAVSNDLDYRLGIALRKASKGIDNDALQSIILRYTENVQKPSSILLAIYEHPFEFVLCCLFVLSLVFTVIYLKYHLQSMSKINQQEINLNRFMGYVCKTNDLVLDVNLDTMMCRECKVRDDGKIVYVERPYELILNKPNFIHPDDVENVEKHVKSEVLSEMMSSHNGAQYFECRCKEKDGTYKWYSYTLQNIPVDKEHPCNFVMFTKDIDDVKREDESNKKALRDALNSAKQASEAKGVFLSRVSHEIRTPLNAIIGYTALARDDLNDTDKVRHYLSNSELAAHHLLNIINDVLDMSSIESGRLKIAHESFDLKKMLSTISSIYYTQAKAKNVKFELTLDNLKDEFVVGDELRLNQVLLNLLSNSMKFTPEKGEIKLSVIQVCSQSDRIRIKFVVSDTGIGMSKEYMTKLFTPFEQESSKTAQKFGGTGLGLSITKNLVTMMGGSIDVESEQNVGTKFTVLMTFDYSADNEKIIVQKDFAKVRALIIDNEAANGTYIRDMLKRCGVKCDVLNDPNRSVTKIAVRNETDNPYNLCVMDMNMQGVDSMSIVRQIRERFADSKYPIIVGTAYDISIYEEDAKTFGINKLIPKPLFQSTVFDLLVEQFGKYQPEVLNAKNYEDLKGTRILLAEDNLMNQEIAVDILTKAGLIIDTALNGEIACQMFEKSAPGTYKAILMDIQMPVLDGYEAAKHIRNSSHVEATTIPIIAMTANAFNEDIAKALASGMNDHIAKPIDYTKLFHSLSRFTQGSQGV